MHVSEGQLPTHSFKQRMLGARSAAGSGNTQMHRWRSCSTSSVSPAHHWALRALRGQQATPEAPSHQAQCECWPWHCTAQQPYRPSSFPHTKGMKTECLLLTGWLKRLEWDDVCTAEYLAHSKSSIKASCCNYSKVPVLQGLSHTIILSKSQDWQL